MQEFVLDALVAHRSVIRERWEILLRAEKVTTPLANPESLIYMMDWTLNEVFKDLHDHRFQRKRADRPQACLSGKLHCPCGNNPMLAYFVCLDQVMMEALVTAQAGSGSMDPVTRDTDLAIMKGILEHIAQREINAFCAVCQHRNDVQPHHEAKTYSPG